MIAKNFFCSLTAICFRQTICHRVNLKPPPMTATFRRPASKAALATPCDFSKFDICTGVRRQLEQIGWFGCDSIWYGELEKTMTSGHLDGYRWLFAVIGRDWFFLVFRRGNAKSVQWENREKLAFQESWHMQRALEPGSSPYLPHPLVFQHLLESVKEFRVAKPFG